MTCAEGVNVDSGGGIASVWLAGAAQALVPLPGDAATPDPELTAAAAMRWALMVSDLAGELQPQEPSAPGPSRSFERKSQAGPHVPVHALRWRDTGTAVSGHKRTLGFR